MSSKPWPFSEAQMDADSEHERPQSARYIRFGPYQVDRQRQQVMRKGVRLKMHGKVYQVLLALIEKQGQIVTREEIKQALWPGNTYVNYDANVNTTLNKLRQVLGDSSEQPIYIETIPRKGYVFLGQAEYSTAPFAIPVEVEEPDDPAARGKASGAEIGAPPEVSSRWLTVGIIVLILAGILLGAGIATLWMSHVSGGGKFF